MVLCPTSRVRREIYCAGLTGSSFEEMRSRLLAPCAQGANTSVPEPAPRSAWPSGLTSAGRRGIGAQTRSTVLVQDVRTAPATQNPDGWDWGLLPECARTTAFAAATVPFQPGLPLQGPPPHSLWFSQKCHLTGCDSSLGHPLCPMQSGTCVRLQHFGSGFSSSVPSIQAESVGEEFACASHQPWPKEM